MADGLRPLSGYELLTLTEQSHVQAEVEVRGLESGASPDVAGQVSWAAC